MRCSPEKLEERLKNRGYTKRKIAENILSELLDTILIEVLTRFPSEVISEIDTTYKKPAEIVDEISAVIKGKEGKSFGEIDWLRRMAMEREMDALLKKIERETL